MRVFITRKMFMAISLRLTALAVAALGTALFAAVPA
jgi:hypothetical protein